MVCYVMLLWLKVEIFNLKSESRIHLHANEYKRKNVDFGEYQYCYYQQAIITCR